MGTAYNRDVPGGPDPFPVTEPGHAFLSEQMIYLTHGQQGSRDDSDAIIPLIRIGAVIPSNAPIAPTDLRCIASLVCRLLRLTAGDFDLEVPMAYKTQ